jgi:hypothetical protein
MLATIKLLYAKGKVGLSHGVEWGILGKAVNKGAESKSESRAGQQCYCNSERKATVHISG